VTEPEPLELGPDASKRLPATPCPWCEAEEQLIIYDAERWVTQLTGFSLAGVQAKGIMRRAVVPVLECKECGLSVPGRRTVDPVTGKTYVEFSPDDIRAVGEQANRTT
jgi:hypothetical protein